MTSPAFHELLSTAEVRELTGESKPAEQERVLCMDGVPFRRRGERILVSRFHVREWLAGKVVRPSKGMNLAAVK